LRKLVYTTLAVLVETGLSPGMSPDRAMRFNTKPAKCAQVPV
jgi:hypothetical protein